MDERERLKFIADFANADFEKLREGDVINLQADFERFFEMRDEDRNTPGKIHYNPPKTGKPFPAEKLQALHQELQALLNAAFNPAFKGLAKMPVKYEYMRTPTRITVFAGEHRDLFLLKVGRVLEHQDEDESILKCEPCGKFFHRVRRQKFCSHQCAALTGKKVWLDRQAKKKEEAQKKVKRRK